jgi:hypothetical protein
VPKKAGPEYYRLVRAVKKKEESNPENMTGTEFQSDFGIMFLRNSLGVIKYGGETGF